MTTWLQLLKWSKPHSISQLTEKRGSRTVIPDEPGFYAFVDGPRKPFPDNCLYVGIAARQSLYRRLGSYLRSKMTAKKAVTIKHVGKRHLAFARIKGVRGEGHATANTKENDKHIHVCWTPSPMIHDGSLSSNSIEAAYMLERAMVYYYRPLYNTADWDPDLDFEMEEDIYWEMD